MKIKYMHYRLNSFKNIVWMTEIVNLKFLNNINKILSFWIRNLYYISFCLLKFYVYTFYNSHLSLFIHHAPYPSLYLYNLPPFIQFLNTNTAPQEKKLLSYEPKCERVRTDPADIFTHTRSCCRTARFYPYP